MPYPKNLETKLEFDQVKEMVKARCLSVMGQQYVEKIRFVNRLDLLSRMLEQTREFKVILSEDQPFPADHYFDISHSLSKARIEGVWLLEEELHQLKLVLSAFLQITRYLRDRAGKYPQLEALLDGLIFNDLLIRRIERILDLEGNMKPNASPELAKLSAKINEREAEIRKRINKLFEKNSDLGYLTEQIGITIRDGRLVLPVLAEHKRHVPGFVHDESQTGQTVFIEPTDCFDLNNVLRELQISYRRERERILLEITDQIRPHIPEIELNMNRMGLFDFIRSKALLALEMKADLPLLSKHPGLELYQAYHPILKMNHDKQGITTVPLSLKLNNQSHIVVISGPNAGGKSVCLKTVGLLQYMLQCGFLVPCQSHSVMGIYKEIMVDIGDEQSIENDLSTYSSHLLHMKNFCDFADGKTLFLIDEFGTGTDPQFGGPLAEAILHQLMQKRAHGVVTTHFSNLKNFAANNKGLENACMLFDHEKMQPLYQLELGKPGSSYAFELAYKSGLPETIINYAKNKVGGKQKKVDDLLLELEKEQKQVRDLKQRLSEKEGRAEVMSEQYERLKADLENQKREYIKKAKQEALALVSEANAKVEALIREIKENQANIESQRKARTEIKETIQELKTFVEEERQKELEQKAEVLKPVDGEIKVGSKVQLRDQESVGEVLELNKNKAVVALGGLRTTVDIKKLVLLKQEQAKLQIREASKGIDLNDKMRNFQAELNLIGTRGEDAILKLREYLDDAHLLGIKQVRIVHGKGYGILRKLVREFLAGQKYVTRVQDEHIDFGGDGVSLVTLD
ncbi:MAG: Smr/MutS family protein [Bacteroidetes bacterium]|nr:Smr/MutS family protein [Bacteroidota bacterium]